MSEMVERVAKALSKERDREVGDGDFTDMARAAIEAMREPTEAMQDGCLHEDTIRYKKMIDAALGEDR